MNRYKKHPRLNTRQLGSLGILLASAVALFPSQSYALVYTWTGGGSDNNWSNATNWGGTAPSGTQASGASNDLVLGLTTATSPLVDLNSPWYAHNLYLANSAGNTGSITLTGNDLSLSGNTITAAKDPSNVNNNGTFIHSIGNNITLTSNVSVTISSGNVSGGNLNVTGNITATNLASGHYLMLRGNGNNSVIQGKIAPGSGSQMFVVKSGGGIWTFSNASNAISLLNINQGTAKIGVTDGLGLAFSSTGPAISLGNTAKTTTPILDLNGYSQHISSLTVATGNVNDVAVKNSSSTASTLIYQNDSNENYSGAIQGNILFQKYGAGTFTLSGTNTYTGLTTVFSGKLDVNGSLASGTVHISSGAALGGSGTASGIVTGTNATINGSGLTTGAVTLDGASQISGTTSASSITIKSGTTSNQGTNTVTNGLIVKAGAALNNTGSTQAATVTVETNSWLANNGSLTATNTNVSGLLSGTGAINGALTILSGGDLAPGNSPGSMTINGSLTVSSGAKVSMQFESLSAYDTIISNGVTLSGTLALDLSETFLSEAGALSSGTSLLLIDNTSSDPIGNTFENITYTTLSGTYSVSGNSFTIGSTDYCISYTGGDGNDVTLTVVPEPSIWAMLAGGIGLLIKLQKIRGRARD